MRYCIITSLTTHWQYSAEGGGRMQNSSNIKEIVNVVEEYNYDTQSEKYNQEFKRWRKNKQNPYAFNFEMNRKESVYIESKGFKAPNMYDAEAETIGKIASIAGIAMIIWIFVDTLLSKLIIQIFDYIGFDIHSNFFSSSLYGGGKEIVGTDGIGRAEHRRPVAERHGLAGNGLYMLAAWEGGVGAKDFKVPTYGEVIYRMYGRTVPSLRFAAYREGVTDIRYLDALRALRTDDPEVKAFLAKAPLEVMDEKPRDPKAPDRVREEARRLILKHGKK